MQNHGHAYRKPEFWIVALIRQKVTPLTQVNRPQACHIAPSAHTSISMRTRVVPTAPQGASS